MINKQNLDQYEIQKLLTLNLPAHVLAASVFHNHFFINPIRPGL